MTPNENIVEKETTHDAAAMPLEQHDRAAVSSDSDTPEVPVPARPRKPGRPRGSKNKTSAVEGTEGIEKPQHPAEPGEETSKVGEEADPIAAAPRPRMPRARRDSKPAGASAGEDVSGAEEGSKAAAENDTAPISAVIVGEGEAAGDRTASKKSKVSEGDSGEAHHGSGNAESYRRQPRQRSNGTSPNGTGNNGRSHSNGDKGSGPENRSHAGTNKGNAQGKGAQQQQQQQRRRQRRSFNNHEPLLPRVTSEELESLKLTELREKAVEFEVDLKGVTKKDEIIKTIIEGVAKADGLVACEGILDLLPEGYGFLRTSGYLPGENDVYVGVSMVRRNGLREGDYIVGQLRPSRENEKYPALNRIDTVNGATPEEAKARVKFADLTPIFPDERLLMEHGKDTITARTIDLVAPIGKGQRGLIVSPPKAGKTTILKDIAAAISANDPNVHLMCLLVDERPEEVTDMERSIKGEVVSSTFDMPSENHIAVAELVIERAKRLVENGEDVVILLDSITRLARAYNLAQPASGRVLSGGVDSTALYPPKRFLGAARNIENGGSLTILASALIDTGSKMDEVIFEEFKGTGNMELKLDRALADRRIFPAIDPISSGTRKEELLLDPQEAPLIWGVRRILANLNNTERAMDMLIKSLKQTQNNAEFLMKMAKKGKGRTNEEFSL